jgi:rare lipoprotein A
VNARRFGRHPLIALLALASALLVPAAAASASGGGGGLAGGTDPFGPTTTATSTTTTPVSTSGDGLTLDTVSSSLMRHQLALTGTATAAGGQEIEIEREGKQTGWLWQPVAEVPVAADGSFSADWITSQPGRYAVRAQVASGDLATAAAATPSLTVTVYRPATATLYGPGFYGNKTACGARLTRTTIGVANRTLPCGSTVSLLFRGRTMAVPVIDRGPYANGANWDLTTATATAIGMDGTEQIGAVVLPKVPPAVRRAANTPPAPSAPPAVIGVQTAG